MKKDLLTRIWTLICHLVRYYLMYVFFLSSATMCSLIANVNNISGMGYIVAFSWLAYIANHIDCMWRVNGMSVVLFEHIMASAAVVVVSILSFDYVLCFICLVVG